MSRAGRLNGKVAVITGGAGGIGSATARLFAREGVEHLYLVDRDEARLAKIAAEIEGLGTYVRGIKADLIEPEACQNVVNEVAAAAGRIDILISNAGIGNQVNFLEISREMWDFEVAINLSMHFFMCQAAARLMVAKGKGGAIVCTASAAGYGGLPRMAPYAATKAGLINLVKTMALELAPYGIRVNSLSPGGTDTPLAESQVGKAVLDEMRKSFPAPLGRLARPEEMANGFLFLASDEASYVTAVDLAVDSGVTQYAVSYQITK